MPYREKIDTTIFKNRRNDLVKVLKTQYPHQADSGVIVLFGGFEHDRTTFRQESSFYYLTGVEEPASAVLIDIRSGFSTLYLPNFGKEREKWVDPEVTLTKENKNAFGFDALALLGEPCKGYQCHPFFTPQEYSSLLKILKQCIQNKQSIFTFNPTNQHAYIEQRFIIQRIHSMLPGFNELCLDISPLVAHMRRTKTHAELELLYKAIDITMKAHLGICQEISADNIEYELQALIEYMFVSLGGSAAFPSIIASGKNSTILHYHHNNKHLKKGDVVVIDIGADYNYYCADITRTYPVSGRYTKRQRELYSIVLETQNYIASLAQPGYWLSNKEQPHASLHHLAQEFLRSKGYDQYFTHGIGHFLGIDVHDVGDYQQPLQPGDVITIEPGIYIPEENIGIRIEDNYWIVEDGAVCLSEELPKHPDDIEKMMSTMPN